MDPQFAIGQIKSLDHLIRHPVISRVRDSTRESSGGGAHRSIHDDRDLSYVFYKMTAHKARVINAPDLTKYHWVLWRPGLLPPRPAIADVAWTAMHHLHVFSNNGYCRVFAYDEGQLVHRLTVFPKWLRYPFMAANDLQIGNVWTDDRHRGRGLATAFIQKVVASFATSGRSFWYVTARDNLASRGAAEHAGFEKFGSGERCNRYGSRLLGAFELKKTEPALVVTRETPLVSAGGNFTRTEARILPSELADRVSVHTDVDAEAI
jgi:RimJ/RimL family protein N-acetyltransferase